MHSSKNTFHSTFLFNEILENRDSDIYQKHRICQKDINISLKRNLDNLNNTSSLLVSKLPSLSLFLEGHVLNIVLGRLNTLHGLKSFQKNILNKSVIFSHFHYTEKTVFHRVCNGENIRVDWDQLRIKTYPEESRVLLFPIKHVYYFYYHLLAVISMFLSFLSFIIHLFIIIYNLLSIYSLLFLSLLVYIFYYFLLFLEVENKRMKKLENPYFIFENSLFFKRFRRYLYVI